MPEASTFETRNATGHAQHSPAWARAAFPALFVLFALLWLAVLARTWHKPFEFDDAFMFYRYAEHMRAGMGVSWNAGDGHTYGPTSLAWTFLIFLLSYLPFTAARVLVFASWLSGAAGVLAMGWAVAGQARSRWLASPWKSAAVLALPVALTQIYRVDATNGMETMLGLTANALTAGFVLRWLNRPDGKAALSCGLMGVAAFLCRPDSALLFVLLVGLAGMLMLREGWVAKTSLVLGVYFAGLIVEALCCKLYFHSVLPLSFYVKSGHGYDGYLKLWHNELAFYFFLQGAVLFLLLLALMTGKNNWRLVVSFLVPVTLASFYFTGFVLQIMGGLARYYLPLLPFVAIPAMLLLDQALTAKRLPATRPLLLRMSAFVVLCVIAGPLALRLDHRFAENRMAYDAPVRVIAAKSPLPPIGWFPSQRLLTSAVVAPLPNPANVAATEVGYLGAELPGHTVIDISGLNDISSLTRQPMSQILFQKLPDIIWLPVPDYSYLYGSIYSSPEFLRNYTVFDGFLNYGLAVRKSSPYYSQILGSLTNLAASIYPGYNLNDYVVQSVTWDKHKSVVPYRD